MVNVNTSESMTEVIAASARRLRVTRHEIVGAAARFSAPAAVDCNFESYLSAVAVMDRVLAYASRTTPWCWPASASTAVTACRS